MPGKQISGANKPFLKIVQGNISQAVDEGTEGAKLRKYELKDGTKGEKWELQFMNWTAKINNIAFKDSDCGHNCLVDLEDATLLLPTNSRYFKDFAAKIMNADLSKEITIHPYDMESDGKRLMGVSLKQEGVKLENYYWDAENKKYKDEYPKVDEEKKERHGYWKIYFTEVEGFLIDELKKLHFEMDKATETELSYDELGADLPPELSDLPF